MPTSTPTHSITSAAVKDLAPAGYRLSDGSSLALDVVRAVSAEIVLVGHLLNGLDLAPSLRPPHQAYMQNVAVVVFFLLSGFLITYVVLRRRSDPGYGFGSYFIDRFARIYSGFLPAIAVVFVLDSLQIAVNGLPAYGHSGALDLRTATGNILMLQDFPFTSWIVGVIGAHTPLGVTSFGSGRTFWTLAIEWWIYLAFGWAILASPLLRHRKIVYGAVLLAVSVVPAWNLVAGRGNGLTLMWLSGGAVYLVLRTGVLDRIRASAAGFGSIAFLVLALVRLRLTKEAYDALFAILLAAALCFLIVAVDRANPRVPARLRTVVDAVAGYSFTLFLTHLSVYELIRAWVAVNGIELSGWTLFVMIFVAANLLAFVIASLFETKHRELGRWLKARVPWSRVSGESAPA